MLFCSEFDVCTKSTALQPRRSDTPFFRPAPSGLHLCDLEFWLLQDNNPKNTSKLSLRKRKPGISDITKEALQGNFIPCWDNSAHPVLHFKQPWHLSELLKQAHLDISKKIYAAISSACFDSVSWSRMPRTSPKGYFWTCMVSWPGNVTAAGHIAITMWKTTSKLSMIKCVHTCVFKCLIMKFSSP